MQSRACPTYRYFFCQLLTDDNADKVVLRQSVSVEAYTHLAHSVVRYLGLTAPSDLEEYGIMSTVDLVSFISRVRCKPICHSSLAHSDDPSLSRTHLL